MKKTHFLTLILALSSFITKAQVNAYTFLEDGSSFPYLSASGAVITEHTVNDDMVTPAIVGMPFTFNFGGDNYTSLGISENGFIWFGSAQPSDVPFIAPISQTQPASVQGIISALGIDLHPINTALAQTKISSAVVGQTPNRTFVIEWLATARIETLDDTAGTDIIDFQIRLSETTNKVEITYGRSIMNPNLVSYLEVGMKTSDDDFNIRTTGNTNWSTTEAGTTLSNTCELSSLSKPAFGQKLIWLPGDLGVDGLDTDQLVLYPIPANEEITLFGLELDAFNYVICDMTGRTIKQNSVSGNTISLDGIPAGNYLVNITNGNLSLSRKFVKL